jgi:hypothetical protein
MRRSFLAFIVLVVTPALAFSQTDNPSAKNSDGQSAANSKTGSTITGCLTSSRHHTYRLVDEKGITNMVYSKTVHLDTYVGQFVSLVGDVSATPSTDTGTGRPTPHFVVKEVHPASGTCK